MYYTLSILKDNREICCIQLPLGVTSAAHNKAVSSEYFSNVLLRAWELLKLGHHYVVTLDGSVCEDIIAVPGDVCQLTLSKGNVHYSDATEGNYSEALSLHRRSASLVGKARIKEIKGLPLTAEEARSITDRARAIKLYQEQIEKLKS
jgi:hypothetical protein